MAMRTAMSLTAVDRDEKHNSLRVAQSTQRLFLLIYSSHMSFKSSDCPHALAGCVVFDFVFHSRAAVDFQIARTASCLLRDTENDHYLALFQSDWLWFTS